MLPFSASASVRQKLNTGAQQAWNTFFCHKTPFTDFCLSRLLFFQKLELIRADFLGSFPSKDEAFFFFSQVAEKQVWMVESVRDTEAKQWME